MESLSMTNMIKIGFNKRLPRGIWKKYHSCCDWFYKHMKTDREIYFCGLDPNRDKKMKEFEKYRKII